MPVERWISTPTEYKAVTVQAQTKDHVTVKDRQGRIRKVPHAKVYRTFWEAVSDKRQRRVKVKDKRR